jgi:DUF4097 and DUF4098 domain-containing protein YvlB
VTEHEFVVGNTPSVKIGIRSGRIGIEPGEPRAVRFSADTRDPNFTIQQRGDAIEAFGERGGRVDMTVHLPPLTDVEVSTASGDVNVVPPVGRLEVSTASGDLHFESARRLEAKSASGSIGGSRVDGEARCVTASGDIRISVIGDRADLSTASGDIVVDQCAGTITCATLSGDIRVNELTGPSLNAKSMSGGVRIGIPSRTRLDLDANTFSGKVKLPAPNPNPESPEREISVKVRLVSGDLSIVRAD